MQASQYLVARNAFPIRKPNEPAWAQKVPRWYQLDAAAFALAESYWQNQQALGKAPDMIFMSCPQDSRATDLEFIKNPQPVHFVHTLANVRGAFLCQIMNWQGPLYCLVESGSKALQQARLHALQNPDTRIWVVNVKEKEQIHVAWHIISSKS